jgi:hypothetical protein
MPTPPQEPKIGGQGGHRHWAGGQETPLTQLGPQTLGTPHCLPRQRAVGCDQMVSLAVACQDHGHG